ncbi:MAG: DUF6456 domain-containing protein [Methylocystis sp.]|uniref:DUF6456 domain-containing protein n=1 Tax=Methylocystis sp. TaxID=1911079 RepID=UPI003DA55456
MTRAVRNKPDAAATRALLRLLQALAETGAGGAPSDLEDETIVVLAPRNGVTIVRARLAAATGRMAVSQGLAGWTQDGAARRLRLTDAGRAWLRRQATDDEELDPFRAQHAECRRRPLEKGAKPSLVNDAESPLAWLARRKGADGKAFLGPAQVEAGERFRRDIEQAQILQRVTASWEATASASRRGAPAGVVVTDLVIDARKRLSRACEAVGPDLAGLLTDVCGYLKGLENSTVSQRFTGFPRHSHATCASMIYVASSFLRVPAV